MSEKYETGLLQHPQELSDFITLLNRENVRTFLEIGSKFGGSIWRIANKLPVGSKVVSIDLPHGDKSFKESEAPLRACIAKLKSMGYDAHLILGDSTNEGTIERARVLGPYDAIFIDANHTEKYVWADWNTYGPMSRIVAFHDIGWKEMKRQGKKPIEVPLVWRKLKALHRHCEISYCEKDNGIGVLWRS